MNGGVSDPRNAVIMKMFALIGICERVGSGLYSIFDIWKQNHLAVPQIEEAFNPDRITLTLQIELQENGGVNQNDSVIDSVNDSVKLKLTKSEEKIFALLKEKSLSGKELTIAANVSISTANRTLKKLKDVGLIKRIGSDKDGYWQA